MSGPTGKMTAREFIDKLEHPYGTKGGRIPCHNDNKSHLLFCLREAGFEFAPEPIRVPTSLSTVCVNGCIILVDKSVGARLSEGQVCEVVRRAMLYPGLRDAAINISDEARVVLNRPIGAAPYVKFCGALTMLDDELAKGDAR